MKVSLNWLRDYVPLTASPEEIARAITFLGFEVEGIHSTGAPRLDHVVVGEILTRTRHPNADKLSVCTVDVGPAGGVKSIVCGAANCDAGHRVLVALPGAVLPGNFAIKASKIRGQASEGMMCSPDELGLQGDHAGLLLLPDRPALGVSIQEAVPGGDTILDLEITPNRPDCQCHLGIARELAAWFRLPFTYPQERFRGDVSAAAQRPDLLAGVEVRSPADCPYYSAHVVAGIKVGPSPAWLQDRLRGVGLRPINNVVDVTNYVMLETGQPLHAFDARRLEGRRIVVRPAGDGERLVTLDGKERALDARTLVIADSVRAVVVAGVMGGQDSGVAGDTTDLVLECAVFRRQSVRAASRRLGLSTDSSYRYERGVDPHGAPAAAWRAIDLILETAGGSVAGPAFQVGGDVPWSREIVVTRNYIADRLGFDIPAAEMRAAFEALELRVTREEETVQPARGPAWTVAIPSWRDDLDRPIDLVEEVLRLHGTERIPPATVVAPGLAAEDDPVVRFNRQATDYLIGHDFHECINYTLRPAREVAAWASAAELPRLALANPFVDDQTHLRSSLVGGLLESLRLNQARGEPVARLAETGRVFLERDGQVLECVAAAFVIAESSGNVLGCGGNLRISSPPDTTPSPSPASQAFGWGSCYPRWPPAGRPATRRSPTISAGAGGSAPDWWISRSPAPSASRAACRQDSSRCYPTCCRRAPGRDDSRTSASSRPRCVIWRSSCLRRPRRGKSRPASGGRRGRRRARVSTSRAPASSMFTGDRVCLTAIRA